MHNREKAVKCLTVIEQILVCRQEICPQEDLQYWIELQEGVADTIALLKEDCHNCKLECLLQKYDELKEEYDALLKEQEERKGNYVPCKVKTPTGKWNGEKCSVCGTEYIGSAPLQWKFCPDCGAKMERSVKWDA